MIPSLAETARDARSLLAFVAALPARKLFLGTIAHYALFEELGDVVLVVVVVVVGAAYIVTYLMQLQLY